MVLSTEELHSADILTNSSFGELISILFYYFLLSYIKFPPLSYEPSMIRPHSPSVLE